MEGGALDEEDEDDADPRTCFGQICRNMESNEDNAFESKPNEEDENIMERGIKDVCSETLFRK